MGAFIGRDTEPSTTSGESLIPVSTTSTERRIPSLSPTRAADWKSCPQRYKYKSVDRIPEPKTTGMASGILVHMVLERLHALPSGERVRSRADELLSELVTEGGDWDGLTEKDIVRCRELLDNYWNIEDPTKVESEVREWRVEMSLGDQLLLRGIIDRVDRVDGQMMLSDYKTGRVPSEAWEMKAFFGLRFYSLIAWKLTGQVPAAIRLLYLAEPTILMIQPDEMMLRAMEKQLLAISQAIVTSTETGVWAARPSRLCGFCPYVELCPAWEGRAIPPEWAERLTEARLVREAEEEGLLLEVSQGPAEGPPGDVRG